MGLDLRLAREIAPFAAATLVGFALIPLGNGVGWTAYGLAAALVVAIAIGSVLTPWRRLPRLARLVPWLLFLVAVAALRNAGDGAIMGIGALTLVPVCWVALHGSRAQLVVMIVVVCVFFIAPAVITADEQYSLSMWRLAIMFAAASALVGFAVQALVGRVRAHAEALALRERDLEAMADLSRSLSLVTDARDRICAAACGLSAAHFAVLLEMQGDGTLDRTAGAGTPPPGTFTPCDGESGARTAYRTRTPLYVTATSPDRDAAGRAAALLFQPVHRGDEVVGVLVAGWREPPADERRARGLVRLLASEAAFVIERADLLGRLTESALTDELTGLPNRRAWDAQLERALDAGEAICVAILDLDRFKTYNDDHGHQAGDLLLKEAAAAWRARLRPTDTLARYGGEEFVVLLRETDAEAARGVVDRLRAATPRGQSCSAGVALREDGEGAATLLGRADEALYDAKRAGRDRSLVAAIA